MKNRLIDFCLILSLFVGLIPLPVRAADEVPFNPHYLISDEEMENVTAMTLDDISSFLTRGTLASYFTQDIDNVERSAAEIIWRAANQFELNPQFILALLQREQSLVEDSDPTQDQFDWAMGYAVCDDCSKSDPRIQKFKGFANQIFFAAQRIREFYLKNLDEIRETGTGVGPGLVSVIDGRIVIPINYATSVLYTYTPHLHGNENFVKIWHRWFSHDYPNGSLLQDLTNGAVWLIKHGQRLPITSRTALVSRFDVNDIIQVYPSVLEQYSKGAPIRFPNYSILRSPNGRIYLLVDDALRYIPSMEVFRVIGFNSDEIVNVTFEDLVGYSDGDILTAETTEVQGSLLQDITTGGIFYLKGGIKHPLMSKDLLIERFSGFSMTPLAQDQLALYPTGEPVGFDDGTLIGVRGSSGVFVVADGKRRPIINETTFLSYGWKWQNIVWTNERSVLIHPLGDEIKI